ncbi:MAG: hypothetical protein OEY05_11475 [Paracoccaceae bacterium]|nr:hypothetical protein [Paracoccaceae bacterium]
MGVAATFDDFADAAFSAGFPVALPACFVDFAAGFAVGSAGFAAFAAVVFVFGSAVWGFAFGLGVSAASGSDRTTAAAAGAACATGDTAGGGEVSDLAVGFGRSGVTAASFSPVQNAHARKNPNSAKKIRPNRTDLKNPYCATKSKIAANNTPPAPAAYQQFLLQSLLLLSNILHSPQDYSSC